MNYCLNGNFGYKGLTALIAPNKSVIARAMPVAIY